MLIEVGESSVQFDREGKLPLYCEAQIPEVWLVDLEKGEICLYRLPQEDGYGETRIVCGDVPLSPLAFPQISLTSQQVIGG